MLSRLRVSVQSQRGRWGASNVGFALMLSDNDAIAIVRSIRLIAVKSFDISAAGRLHLLADQIEDKIQTLHAAGDQDAAPLSNDVS
jgi:hypothetical protein